MAALPQPENTTATAVVRWRERVTPSEYRQHLGASVIGHSCDRHLWYVFRWAGLESFDGRTLRMFDTGKREEARVYEELRGIGCDVHADDGTGQFRVSALGGHFGGSMDGVVRGLPEAPKAWHVLEAKTHNDKSFNELVKKGVKAAKPRHEQQMQAYMHLENIDRALYYAINKNTDAIYTERVERDSDAGTRIMARARRVIEATVPPVRLSEDPDYFECRFCPFKDICHGTAAPAVNCRTCVYSTPSLEGDGSWHCAARCDRPIEVVTQRAGCDDHLYIPPLLERFATPIDSTKDSVRYRLANGTEFVNGPPPGFRSIEIRAVHDKVMLGDETMQHIKRTVPSARAVA